MTARARARQQAVLAEHVRQLGCGTVPHRRRRHQLVALAANDGESDGLPETLASTDGDKDELTVDEEDVVDPLVVTLGAGQQRSHIGARRAQARRVCSTTMAGRTSTNACADCVSPGGAAAPLQLPLLVPVVGRQHRKKGKDIGPTNSPSLYCTSACTRNDVLRISASELVKARPRAVCGAPLSCGSALCAGRLSCGGARPHSCVVLAKHAYVYTLFKITR